MRFKSAESLNFGQNTSAMKKFLLLLLLALTGNMLVAQQSVHYTLRMEKPHTHYFEVDMALDGLSGKSIDLKMPVWAPGSYLVREFPGNVDEFKAESKGKTLQSYKTDKNTWRIVLEGNRNIRISYKVYAYELSVRTSFIDASHAYLNGTSVFMYVAGKKHLPGTLRVVPFPEWKKISTSLEATEPWHYRFPDYDLLADSPIEIGNHHSFYFEAAGVTHEIAMYGEGNYDSTRLKHDMALIAEECTRVFGENPVKNYVFIIHNLSEGGGGLEHLYSTTLQVNRWSYTGSGYYRFLNLVAHEYFHLWLVKRLRPDVLGPFDYDRENYTTLLWVMEGFTSYYADLILRRAGFYDTPAYLRTFSNVLTNVENQPGNKVQSVTESSFDAWIKAYRPHDNSVNSSISYYSKGQVLGALLDISLIEATGGEKKLDDLLRHLYQEYYKKRKRGLSEAEFRQETEKMAGRKMDTFFTQYVYGTATPDYKTLFTAIGLKFEQLPRLRTGLGATLSLKNGKLMITRLLAGESGYEAGLNVNDEIIAVQGWRVNQAADLNRLLDALTPGDEIELLINRQDRIYTLNVKLLPGNQHDYQVTLHENPQQNSLWEKWLN